MKREKMHITVLLKKRRPISDYFLFILEDLPIFLWILILPRKFAERFLVTYAYKKTGLLLPLETWGKIGMKYLKMKFSRLWI